MNAAADLLHAVVYTVGLYHTLRWSWILVTSLRVVPKDRGSL